MNPEAPRILLIQPPVRDFYTTEVRLQPLGLAYLKAAILSEFPGAVVKISDHHGGNRKRRTVPLPRALSHLRKIYEDDDRGPFSTFYQFYHFGSTPEEIQKDVEAFRPDFVGISSLFSAYYEQVLETARTVKKAGPIPVICGGTHATVHPESLLKDDAVDFVIRGEGESPLISFLHVFIEKRDYREIPGLQWKENGVIHQSRLPSNPSDAWKDLIPDFSDFNNNAYLYKNEKIAFIQYSRGCPASCSFCSIHPLFGKRHRRRTTESILKEMEIRYEQGFRVFDFEDDNLTFARKDSLELFHKISEVFRNRPVQLHAMNGLYYPKLDEEILIAMKEAGFFELNLSYVSQNEFLLESHSRHTNADFASLVSTAHRIGFHITAYFIIGLPGDSFASILDTIVELAMLPLLLGASPYYQTPGMPLTQDIRFHHDTLLRGRLTAMEPSEILNSEEIHTLLIMTRILNYLKQYTEWGKNFRDGLDALKNRSRRDADSVALLEALFQEGILYTNHNGIRKVRGGFSTRVALALLDKLDRKTGGSFGILIPKN